MVPGDVLPEGRVGRRHASVRVHADGRDRAGRAPRLAAGSAGRRGYVGRLPDRRGRGGDARAAVLLARAVAAEHAHRAGYPDPPPITPPVAALPVHTRDTASAASRSM